MLKINNANLYYIPILASLKILKSSAVVCAPSITPTEGAQTTAENAAVTVIVIMHGNKMFFQEQVFEFLDIYTSYYSSGD